MNSLYLLLYVPLVALIVLVLLGTLKLVKDHQEYSRESLLRNIGAVVAVTLFSIGFAVMTVTHGRSSKVAMSLVMAMALVNALRLMTFSKPRP